MTPLSPVSATRARRDHSFGASMSSGRTQASNSSAADISRGAIASSRRLVPLALRRLGDLRRLVIADLRRQRGRQHQRAAHRRVEHCRVGARCPSTQLTAKLRAASASRRALSRKAKAITGLNTLSSNCPCDAGEGDGRLIAEHPRANHGQRLDLGGIDLARHDRRAGLVLRQGQLAQTGARPAARQPDVAGDFVKAGRRRLQCAMARKPARHGWPAPRRNFRAGLNGRPVSRAISRGETLGEVCARVESGADRRAALRQINKAPAAPPRSAPPQRKLRGIAGKFLSQRDRRGVLHDGCGRS